MRRSALVIGLACAALACATAPSDVTQLVSRSATPPEVACGSERCWWWQPAWTFRDERGATAIMDASRRTTRYRVITPDAACGDSSYAYGWLHDDVDEAGGGSTLRFEDGSVVDLSREHMIGVPDLCMEERGRWEGVEGAYDGRAGTYRLLWEGLQTELTLTDA
jgi:hypothetical protein